MQYQSLQQTPGVNVEKSALNNGAGWSWVTACRFRDGMPEKTGGFQALNNGTALVGICRGLHAWSDLAGNPYIAAGTEQRLELFSGGMIQDITPLRVTTNAAPAFSTVMGSKSINVQQTSHGAAASDWIDIFIPVSVGGIILYGFYQVQTVVDVNNFTITSATAATSAVTNGGAVPSFTTINTSGDVTVNFNNHGQVAGSNFQIQIATTVGGITIAAGNYTVVSVTNANAFVIQPGGTATSSATVSENGGNAQIQYLVPTGLVSSGYPAGYGQGPYGGGPYGGTPGQQTLQPARQWFLDNFGQDLVGNYTGSPIFVWQPPTAIGNVALAINTTNYPGAQSPPTKVNVSFVAAPQQMIIALGCDDYLTGIFNPNLVRWCDQSDFTNWAATSVDQAGQFPLPGGSAIVGGLSAPNFTVIWTNTDMWLMNYLGGQGGLIGQLVWGFTKIAGSVGLLAPRACAVFRNLVFFASSNGMYVFDGNKITLIPCTVWDKFWKNLNRDQIAKVNMQVNSYFQEISIASQSLTGTDVDQRITYSMRENTWTYDDAPTLLARTAWIDENVYGAMIGTDTAGLLQQQDSEGVYDANGAPLPAAIRTGWFSAQEGTALTMMERIESELIVNGGTGSIMVTIYAQDYATGPVRSYGPYPWVIGSGPPWAIVRARGRFLSIMISSTDLGVFWRLGNTRYTYKSAGGRP